MGCVLKAVNTERITLYSQIRRRDNSIIRAGQSQQERFIAILMADNVAVLRSVASYIFKCTEKRDTFIFMRNLVISSLVAIT